MNTGPGCPLFFIATGTICNAQTTLTQTVISQNEMTNWDTLPRYVDAYSMVDVAIRLR